MGDFNFCYLDKNSNCTKNLLDRQNFKQLVKEPTHIDGNLIDHAYLRDLAGKIRTKTIVHNKYYSDHKGLAVMIQQGTTACK